MLTKELIKEAMLHLCFVVMLILCTRLSHSNVADKLYDDIIENSEKIDQQCKEKETFFACMSHEIRNPIQSLMGALELLLPLTAKISQAKQLLNILKSCCEIVLNFVNNILDISKVQAGKMELSTVPCDPREAVLKVVRIMQGKAEGKGLVIKFIDCPNLPPALELDSTKMNQVILNILSNAVKFTQQGEVSVELFWESDKSKIIAEFNDALEESSHQNLTPYIREYTPSSNFITRYLNRKGKIRIKRKE